MTNPYDHSPDPDDEVVVAEIVVEGPDGSWVTPEELERDEKRSELITELACFSEAVELASWTNLTPYLAWVVLSGDKTVHEAFSDRGWYGFQMEEAEALEYIEARLRRCAELNAELGEWIDADDNWVPLAEWAVIYERDKATLELC